MSTSANPIKNAYQDRQKVLDMLAQCRKIFGDRNTTKSQYKSMQECLGFAYLYCPDDLKELVRSTLQESALREVAFINIWK